jgi:hypothetical protein
VRSLLGTGLSAPVAVNCLHENFHDEHRLESSQRDRTGWACRNHPPLMEGQRGKRVPARRDPNPALSGSPRKSLWYQNVLANQGVRPRFQKTDISEFESSHPSQAVASLYAVCARPEAPDPIRQPSQARPADPPTASSRALGRSNSDGHARVMRVVDLYRCAGSEF